MRGRGLRQSSGLSSRDERSEVTEMDVLRIGEGVSRFRTRAKRSFAQCMSSDYLVDREHWTVDRNGGMDR